MEIELLNPTTPPPPIQKTEYFVREFEIELSENNEIALIQYFCNSLNEPIFFPDRTLASLFNVNLSTLRGRFNRLTKQYEGYRILISEKSKSRIGLNHYINWTSNTSNSNNSSTNSNSNNNPTGKNINNNSSSNYNKSSRQSNSTSISTTNLDTYSSPNSSPPLEGVNTNNNNNNNNTNINNNNSLPLHGLVALNHIKLVNVALSEWIATNHERLGTKLANIEKNFKRSEIPYQRSKDVISIVITKKEDMIPPFPITGNLLPYYFPRQTGIRTSSPNQFINTNQLILEDNNSPSSNISTPTSLNSPQGNSPKISSLSSSSSKIATFKNLQLNQSSNSKRINFNNNNNNNMNQFTQNNNNSSNIMNQYSQNNSLKTTTTTTANFNRISPDLFVYSDDSYNSNSIETSRSCSPDNYSHEDFDNYIPFTYNNNNQINNTRKRSMSNDNEDQYMSVSFRNELSTQQRIYKSNSQDEVLNPNMINKLSFHQEYYSPQSLKKYKSTSKFKQCQQQANLSPLIQNQTNCFNLNNNNNNNNIIINQNTNNSYSKITTNNNNILRNQQQQCFNYYSNSSGFGTSSNNNNNICKWIDCTIDGNTDVKRLDISDITCYDELKDKLSKLFSLISFNIFVMNHQLPPPSSFLYTSHEEWNEFIGKVRKIVIKPTTTTPEIKNLIH